MVAWYLNPFLTSWRGQVNTACPHRTKSSDGTIGDEAHQQTDSQHNRDTDGSVDAWDCDVNLLGSPTPTGTAAEIALMWTLIGEFERQPQAQLWIFRGRIANRDVGNWRVRTYSGPNKHDHHCHFQSRQARENQPYTGELDEVLPATNRTGDDMTKAEMLALLRSDEGKQAVAQAVWEQNIGAATGGANQQAQSVVVTTNVRAGYLANQWAPAVSAVLTKLGADLAALDADVDEDELALKLAAAIPAGLAQKVADELYSRLAA